jgi:hypothetical protein
LGLGQAGPRDTVKGMAGDLDGGSAEDQPFEPWLK